VAGSPSFFITGPVAENGDSLTAFSYDVSPNRIGFPSTRRPPKVVLNHAHANDTLLDLWNRLEGNCDEDEAAGCEAIVLRIGTNGAGPGQDFNTLYTQIVDYILSRGFRLIVLQIPPHYTGGAAIAAQNAFIESLLPSRPDMRFVRDCDVICDEDGNALPNTLNVDGIHFAVLGQFDVGVSQGVLSADLYPVDPRLLDGADTYAQNPSSSQWVLNPLMAGTGGTSPSGQAPDDWIVSASNGTVSTSIVAADFDDPVQAPWLRIDFLTGAGSSYTVTIEALMQHPAVSSTFSPIALFDCVMETRLAGVDTTKIAYMVFAAFTDGAPTGQAPHINLPGRASVDWHAVQRNAYQRLFAADYDANSLKCTLQITGAGAFSEPAGYIDLRCASVRGLSN
jgi:hypothetical protein